MGIMSLPEANILVPIDAFSDSSIREDIRWIQSKKHEINRKVILLSRMACIITQCKKTVSLCHGCYVLTFLFETEQN